MRLLACGAHADDVELACGGALALAAERGHEVYILDLSAGEMASNGDPQTRAREAEAAARRLGVKERSNARLPDGRLSAADEEQRRIVVEMIRRVRPDVLLIPPAENRHPDHVQAHRLLSEAAFLAGLARYPAGGEATRPRAVYHYMERFPFSPSFILNTAAVAERKREALSCYASQFQRAPSAAATLINSPAFLDQIMARDRYYGGLAGCECGEPFLAPSPLRLDDPALLLPASLLEDPERGGRPGAKPGGRP
jgi:bacillithiol biosynthesis deacetylase BshB1